MSVKLRIANDCHTSSVVEDVWFTGVLKALKPKYNCPSSKYFTKLVIPKLVWDKRRGQ